VGHRADTGDPGHAEGCLRGSSELSGRGADAEDQRMLRVSQRDGSEGVGRKSDAGEQVHVEGCLEGCLREGCELTLCRFDQSRATGDADGPAPANVPVDSSVAEAEAVPLASRGLLESRVEQVVSPESTADGLPDVATGDSHGDEGAETCATAVSQESTSGESRDGASVPSPAHTRAFSSDETPKVQHISPADAVAKADDSKEDLAVSGQPHDRRHSPCLVTATHAVQSATSHALSTDPASCDAVRCTGVRTLSLVAEQHV
jgi:hypothetical protein